MTGLYNNLEVFAYVVDIKSMEKEGTFVLKGRIKIPLWQETKDNYCDIVAFNDEAKVLSSTLKKGTGGIFGGELVTREYTVDDKQKYTTELVVSSFLPTISSNTFVPRKSTFRGFCTLLRSTSVTESINGETKKKFFTAKNRIACRTLRNGTLFSDILISEERFEKLIPYLTKGMNIFVEAYWIITENGYSYLRIRDIQIISSPHKEEISAKKTPEEKQDNKKENKKNDLKPLSMEDFKKEGFKPIF